MVINKKTNIRFNEFKYVWELYKIDNIFKITRGYVLPVNKTTEFKNSKFKYPVYSS